MRIIGGVLGGRHIRAPRGDATRPTADRVREAVFNILASLRGPLDGLRVLDLFAGSGALGLEALSRGAASVVAVDHGAEAVRSITANARDLAVGERVRVLRADARAALMRVAGPFDLVFVDPPYAADLASAVLAALPPLLTRAPGALVVVEHDLRAPPDPGPAALALVDRRRYGDTAVSFFSPSEDPT